MRSLGWGITEAILDDHTQTVVLKRDWDGRVMAWHPQFWDVAQDDGFTPRLCRPYRAPTKGQVASGIQSVKRSFVRGRPFPTWEAVNPMTQEWVVTVADQRMHGTTFRKPAEAFAEERLRSHGGRPPYVFQTSLLRTVARDCLVTVETNYDVVPAAYVGKRVEVQWGPERMVHISHHGRLIARHPRLSGQHQPWVDPCHYQLLHQQPGAPRERRDGPTGLALTAWTGPFP